MRSLLTSTLAVLLLAGAAPAAPPAGEILDLRVEDAVATDDGSRVEVTLVARLAEGWHINAHEPSLESLIPTVLAIVPPKGWNVGEVTYPEPESFRFAFAGDQELDVYSGDVVFGVPLEGEPLAGDLAFEAALRYQACNDEKCLRPVTVKRTFVVSPEAAGGTETKPASDDFVMRWLTELGLGTTLLFVAFMGLGLNLTPCVYPLVSVTLAFFGGQAGHAPRRVVALASVYVLGIAATFSALGVTAALTGGLFGALLQKPATLVVLALLMVALALSSFGFWSLRLPAALTQRTGMAATGFAGAFTMGLTMGLVAAPCVGPVIIGLLVAVAALGDAFLGFLLFFALAVGMGAPYVLLGAAAGSLGRLPRSGEWLAWVEHVFGFLLLGLALYFLMPLIPDELFRWLVPAFVAVAGLVLGFLDPSGRTIRFFPLAKGATGVAALALAGWIAWPGAAERGVEWQEYSEAALREAAERSRPAVLDFRADWCLPCIEMEHTTFVAPEVIELSDGFTMLQADVTEMNDSHEAILSRHKVLGVPTTIFFDPSGTERHRIVGYVDAERFLELLESTRNGTEPADALRDDTTDTREEDRLGQAGAVTPAKEASAPTTTRRPDSDVAAIGRSAPGKES